MQASRPQRDTTNDRADLAPRYGRIGIPAVAAALPYQSAARNPAYAPAVARPRDDDEGSQD